MRTGSRARSSSRSTATRRASGPRCARSTWRNRFVTQTFVAVQPDGLDPCDLRLKHGDAAVRDLIARRVPLFEFAVRSVLTQHNLDTTEGQLAALDDAAPIVARIKDGGLRKGYAANLDRWLGLMDEEFVLAPDRPALAARARSRDRRIRRHGRTGPAGAAARRSRRGRAGQAPSARRRPRPHAGRLLWRHWLRPGDPVVRVERQALKLAVQRPALCGPAFDALGTSAFTVPVHAATFRLIAACGGVAGCAQRAGVGGAVAGRRPGGRRARVRDRPGGRAAGGAPRLMASRMPATPRGSLPGWRAGRVAADRGGQVAAAADEPGGAAGRVQPAVR